jgi:hypothetical protein
VKSSTSYIGFFFAYFGAERLMEVRMRSAVKLVLLVGIFGFISYTPAVAAPIVCDLTTATSCTINGGIFSVLEIHPAGTGLIDSFVRVQEKGDESGYNTSYRAVQFDEKTDPNFTRDLRISEVGTTDINGVLYAAFYLDVNEPASGDKELITLDQLELFTTNLPMRTGYTGTPNTASGDLPGTTKVYDLDFGGDNYVQLSYNRIGRGSGSSDMVFYLPMSLFTGEYVNLYSQFGNIDGSANKFDSEAGFEEWFTRRSTVGIAAVPEPATLLLVALGLLGGVHSYRKIDRH